ncbi:MAG TPA: MarC family protein [Xanthobacteraceae bacterium]
MLGTSEIFILLFVTLGPLKTIGPFAARTQGISEQRIHQLALRTFLIATIGVVLGVLLGESIAGKWHVSLAAMTMAAGIILFLVAMRQLMEQYNAGQGPVPGPLAATPMAAAAQLVFPIVLTPYGIAAAITLLISSKGVEGTTTVLCLLVSVMCLDLAAMWFVRRILAGFMPLVFQVLGSVLAVLQVGLAIQLILVGLTSLHIVPA